MKTNMFLTTMMAMMIAFSSCTKDGATGPEGATGPQGTTGQNGTNGTNGSNGNNGVSNLSSSFAIINPGNWVAASGYYYATFTDAAITNSNEDGVEVFFNTSNSSSWQGLPTENVFVNGDQITFVYSNSTITYYYIGSTLPTKTVYFKTVVIPPSSIVLHPNTNWGDYSQVEAIIESQK